MPPPQSGDTPITEQPTRTVVVFQPDGPPAIKTEVITTEQYLADYQARRQLADSGAPSLSGTAPVDGIGSHQQAISQDTGCAASSMWIFDNVNNKLGRSVSTKTGCPAART
jgi:hypothetical protein